MCAYHQFNFYLISLCRTSPLKELSLSSDQRITKSPGRISQYIFSIGTKCMLLLKLTNKTNFKSNIMKLNDNTWRISITKVHIIHVFTALWKDNYFVVDMIICISQISLISRANLSIDNKIQVKEHFYLLNDSKLLQFIFIEERWSLVLAILKPFLSPNEKGLWIILYI